MPSSGRCALQARVRIQYDRQELPPADVNRVAHLVSISTATQPAEPVQEIDVFENNPPNCWSGMSNAEQEEAVMSNRMSGLLLVLCLVAGYAVRGAGVTAQGSLQGVPLAAGDKVTLIYRQVSSDRMAPQTDCAVMDLQGPYVKCAPGPKQAEHWINLTFVVEIVKHPK
jgi:hypothetical protein